MNDLRNISSTKENLDRYEVENIFHSWSFQPAQSPPRVVSAKGVRFTTELASDISRTITMTES